MKNILIITLWLYGGVVSVVAQNTAVPDTNFEQALINLGYDSGPIDGSVLTVNIDTIINLNISGLSITDLTGIEDFIALQVLNCYNNQLTSLNVTQNINLIDLRCDVNQLNAIDVTQNIGLLYLNCGINPITSLDLSQNVNLIALVSSNNFQLTAIDVSQNTSLTYLNCSLNPQLIEVDVRNGNNVNFTYFNASVNPNLKCIYVDDKNASFLSSWIKDTSSHWVNDTLDCQNITSYNEYNNKENTINIYPNPTKEKLNLQLTNSNYIKGNIEIYSIEGKLLLQHQNNNQTATIDVTNLLSGTYYVKLTTSSKTYQQIFIKE